MSRAGPAPPDLAGALAPWLEAAGDGGVLLAVSGGPDSTALLHAAAGSRTYGPVAVATVDHGLRAGSAAEAEGVGHLAHALGLPHRVLTWNDPPATGLQAAARAARYRLLGAHARALGAHLVLTGHTRDDQAETVLMRLVAGSGPAGLAGMARERPLCAGVRLGRPFLDRPKAELVAYCAHHGLAPVADPSNADPRFARARLRALLPSLAAEGLSATRLCRLAERAGRDADALARMATDLLPEGADAPLTLDGGRLRDAPEAVALRAVGLALDRLTGAAPAGYDRLGRLERLVLGELLPALRAGRPLRRTLRGALVTARPDGRVDVAPAPPRRTRRAAAAPQAGPIYLATAGPPLTLAGNAWNEHPREACASADVPVENRRARGDS